MAAKTHFAVPVLVSAILSIVGGFFSATSIGADVVVVCPPSFRDALKPWLLHRRAEGLTVDVIDSDTSIAALQDSVKRTANASTRYVMLVGDAPAIGTKCDPSFQIPGSYVRSKVTVAWGSTPTLLSDMFLGDFDADEVPEAAVGRLPVDRPQQLADVVSRIIAQDNSTDFGAWRGEVQLTGGIGGFGALADATIESVTRAVVTTVLPLETRTSVIYASPGHSFYPAEEPFTDAVLKRYSRGSRFWVYAGHGQVTELDHVPPTAEGTPVLDRESVKQLSCQRGCAPIALMLACYTGAIDAPDDCLAERMLLTEGGPIAVFAGSRVTMPYGNSTAAVGLIDGVYDKKLPRLGDAWLHSLHQMHHEMEEEKSKTRAMIDALAAVISPAGTDLVDERREHMRLYNLLGDPTLRMHQPLALTVQVKPAHDPGEAITVRVKSPISGKLSIHLDRPMGAVIDGDPNKTKIALSETEIRAGESKQTSMAIPPEIHGPCVVRVIVGGEKSWATASAKTLLRKLTP